MAIYTAIYYPINILPSLAKLLEKVVYLQIQEFVNRNNILSEYQSAYRQNCNCETAIQFVLNDWKQSSDTGLYTVIVFLDIRRAFETVDRKRLLLKLSNYGMKGNVLRWIECYLHERRQNVRCEDKLSKNKKAEDGVPQGSTLGPLLFVLYINDIVKVLKYSMIHLFADDTVVYITGKDKDEIEKKLNEDLEDISKWFKQNILKLNTEKTKMMVIGKAESFTIKIGMTVIEQVERVKYLGIIIDRQLKFSDHIDYVCKKIAKKIGVLQRTSSYLSKYSKLTVYNTIILPHYHFASTVLYLANTSGINRLQLLQNRAMRVILNCKRETSVRTMLHALEWIEVKDMLEINALHFVHKISLGLTPNYLRNRLTKFSEVHEHNTRNRENFMLDHKKTRSGQNSIFFKATLAYNKLPSTFKMQSVNKFKRTLVTKYIDDMKVS